MHAAMDMLLGRSAPAGTITTRSVETLS